MRARLGQHFLRDGRVIQTIVAAAELAPSDTALEIGPGKGALTQALVARVRRLVAVELDDALAADLPTRVPSGHLQVVHGDILQTNLDALFSAQDRPVKILGNLPYAVTSPILEKILAWPHWRAAVFLVQREVAERMASLPGSRVFGILSLAVQVFAEADPVLRVRPGAFAPPPEVESMVLRLRRRAAPLVPEETLRSFFDLAHGAFAHRRKTLANSLALHTGRPRAELEKWLNQQGIDGSRRAETLAADEYARLAVRWANYRRELG